GTASQTVLYSRDTQKPVVALALPTRRSSDLTASDIAAAFGAASVSDNCSSGLAASGTVGAESGSGCSFSTTKSWTVTDGCGNTGTASRSEERRGGNEKRVVTLAAASALGCNPTAAQIAAAFGAQTVSYTRDTQKPVVTLGAPAALACNPTAAQIAAACGAASVSDNCSTGLAASGTVGAESGSGCSFSTTKSWTVTDDCGNTGTASQTVSYTRDTQDRKSTRLNSSHVESCYADSGVTKAARGTATA